MSWALFVNFPYPRIRTKSSPIDLNDLDTPFNEVGGEYPWEPSGSIHWESISKKDAKIYEVVRPVFPISSSLLFTLTLGSGLFLRDREAWTYVFERSPGKKQGWNEGLEFWRSDFYDLSEKILSVYPAYEIGAFWIGRDVNYSKPGFDKRYPVTLQEIEYRTVFLCEKVYEIFKDFVYHC
ncbi:MAG TPA: hypothetical protein ENK02_13880 [Planctomycetes bacterium]|nr:hypothetical protein [Planctomycetota bacterium]